MNLMGALEIFLCVVYIILVVPQTMNGIDDFACKKMTMATGVAHTLFETIFLTELYVFKMLVKKLSSFDSIVIYYLTLRAFLTRSTYFIIYQRRLHLTNSTKEGLRHYVCCRRLFQCGWTPVAELHYLFLQHIYSGTWLHQGRFYKSRVAFH